VGEVGGLSYGEKAQRDGAHELERGDRSRGHGFDPVLLFLTDGLGLSGELRFVSYNEVEVKGLRRLLD
jgi:hypothetical protein